MHPSSYNSMQKFVNEYLLCLSNQEIKILDVGSLSICGCYRPLFENTLWEYNGLDLEQGNNVNIVPEDIYDWKEIPDSTYDVIVSGSAFEHIEYPWLTICEIARVLKPCGLICIVAPSSGSEHRHPKDCWRFYPDGFTALAKWAKLIPLDVYTLWHDPDQWHDTVLIAQKPNYKE